MRLIAYIHGKNGKSSESRHYEPLFPGCSVIGLDYRSATPYEALEDIRNSLKTLKEKHDSITIVANSIGAFFSMNAGIEDLIEKAFFISPVVDMEKLILGIMAADGVTETELKSRKTIPTSFGEDLSWYYLCYVREHPINWKVKTEILYGMRDNLTSYDTISAFAKKHGAHLTVMEDGGHWFHTDEEMRFLDDWISKSENFSTNPEGAA